MTRSRNNPLISLRGRLLVQALGPRRDLQSRFAEK